MEEDPRTGEQFLRIIGRRHPAPIGTPPSAEVRRAQASLVQYRTRAPKGIFVYDCHADMEADRLRWTVQQIVDHQRDA